MSIEDAGVAGNEGTDLGTEVPQAVQDKFDEVFSNADADSAETGVETSQSFQASTPSRAAAVAKEQRDELVQEGLETEDGVQEDEAGTTEGQASEDAGQPTEPVQEATPLDPDLRFAAQQFGWTDDKIDKLYAADPEMATSTFTNLLGAFTNLSRQMGPTPAQPPASQLPNPAAQLQQAQQQSKFQQIVSGLKTFSEQNGDDLGGLVQALNEEVYQPLLRLQAEAAVQKQQAIAAEATTVTGSLAEKHGEFYGKGEKLTLVQQQNRSMLYQWADRLRAGSDMQGKVMSVKDAIHQAHLILTADRRVAEGRQQVRQQVQKRSKQITARPTQRVNPRGAGVSKGENQAAEAYARRAQELGIDVGSGE